jgi:hypothetical protein
MRGPINERHISATSAAAMMRRSIPADAGSVSSFLDSHGSASYVLVSGAELFGCSKGTKPSCARSGVRHASLLLPHFERPSVQGPNR